MMKQPSETGPIIPEPGVDLGGLLQERLSREALLATDAARRCSERTGVPAYIVGGPVRDILLGRIAIDIDVVVEGDGIGFASDLASSEDAGMVPYSRFGTALVALPGGITIDVTTARSEKYVRPGVLPEVEPGSLDRDLYRRDFTINAMAIRIGPDNYGEFIDPYRGSLDLKEGLIRILHDGSFRDDPTRILRAVRFRARYCFELDDRTRQMLLRAVDDRMLDEVSRQRLREEIVAILKERKPESSIEELQDAGILEGMFGEDFVFPAHSFSKFRTAEETIGWYASLAEECEYPPAEPWIVRWLLLTGESSPGAARQISDRYHIGQAAIKSITELENNRDRLLELFTVPHDVPNSLIYRSLMPLAPESLILLAAADEGGGAREVIERFIGDLSRVKPWIKGADLVQMGIGEGPMIGTILEEVFSAQLDGIVCSTEDALELARQLAEKTDDAH